MQINNSNLKSPHSQSSILNEKKNDNQTMNSTRSNLNSDQKDVKKKSKRSSKSSEDNKAPDTSKKSTPSNQHNQKRMKGECSSIFPISEAQEQGVENPTSHKKLIR
jgi:hypothetical protein